MALEPDVVKNVKSLNLKALSDEDLKKDSDVIKIFESARSYRASLTIQAMRLAEMEGRTADRDRFKTESEQYRSQYTELSEVVRNIQTETDTRKAVAEAANANANANAKK